MDRARLGGSRRGLLWVREGPEVELLRGGRAIKTRQRGIPGQGGYSQKPGSRTYCLLRSSWPLSALSQAPWGLWPVHPRLQPLFYTPCWTWRNLYHLCPHHPTILQSTPAAQKQMHRGEAGGVLLGNPRKGSGVGPGFVGRDLHGVGVIFQALIFFFILPASRTMAPWTVQYPCTLPIAPLLMRPSWGYEETAR